ncbi:diacylglycerol kinase family lipid kinase [Prolixibacteraceae bacterium Z1-6]|uniref:Diacylglycerol kinase family lipid kinase n=1 Tax=Draconibacterium aestuarii TaxID=2998507 RepID=A0A9X3J9G3_9BACT|nr:diacylglycerol kinase family lipid kinase [Prolixibacteraceae bacterium Z1-6]
MNKTHQTKWTLLLNPHAGGGRGKRDLDQIEKLLQSQGFLYSLIISEYPKHAIQLAKHAVENGCRHLIVAGGDGTLNEVVNGVFLQKVISPEQVLVGMIPVGTGNDWIKTFGIPNSYTNAIEKIEERKTFFQDVGKLTYTQNGVEKQRYFSNMAGFGFDALTAQKANSLKEKGRSGMLVYLQSLLAAFLQYKVQNVKIVIDKDPLEELLFSLSVAIGKYNGGGMKQAPNAIPNNGIFEVAVIKKIGFWGIVRNLAGLYSGSYIEDSRVACFRAKQVLISSPTDLAGEVDGEALGESQFHIEILPQKLQVIVGNLQ